VDLRIAGGLGARPDRGPDLGDHPTPGPVGLKVANAAHAKLRGPGERANAQLKGWRLLRKLRCCPKRAGQLVKAIHVLQARETG